MWSEPPSTRSPVHTQNEECGPEAIQNPLTGYEPKQLDNFGYSEICTATFQNESVDIDTEPSYSFDAELDDELIRKSGIFTTVHSGARRTSEPACHSHEESFLPAESFITRTSTGRPVYEPSADLSQKRKSSRDLENKQIRILLERQIEQILAEVRSEIKKHELQADSDRRSVQELTRIIDSQRMETDHTITWCEQSRRDQLLLQEEMSEQNPALRETRIRNMRGIEELQKSHVLKVDFKKKIY